MHIWVMKLSFHEERKFKEWASRVEKATRTKSHDLRYSCQRLVHWANRTKEIDPSFYTKSIRDPEFSLIAGALPIIYEEHSSYLKDSKRHGKFTKVRQKKVMRFVHQFTRFLVPLALEIGYIDFLKEKIKVFLTEHLQYIFFDLSNLDDYQLDSLLELLETALALRMKDISLLKSRVEIEMLNRQIEEIARKDLEGESRQVEFKDQIPDKIRKLAKEIAAFASTDGGRIYLGVNDDGRIDGIDESQMISFDRLQQGIASITSDLVKPALSVKVEQYRVGDKVIVQINVPKGSEPVYYIRNIPYIRVLTTSRPATPLEVKKLHLRNFVESLERGAME